MSTRYYKIRYSIVPHIGILYLCFSILPIKISNSVFKTKDLIPLRLNSSTIFTGLQKEITEFSQVK